MYKRLIYATREGDIEYINKYAKTYHEFNGVLNELVINYRNSNIRDLFKTLSIPPNVVEELEKNCWCYQVLSNPNAPLVFHKEDEGYYTLLTGEYDDLLRDINLNEYIRLKPSISYIIRQISPKYREQFPIEKTGSYSREDELSRFINDYIVRVQDYDKEHVITIANGMV